MMIATIIAAFILFLVSSFLVWRNARECLLSEEKVFDLYILLLIIVISFSRIMYVLFHFDEFGLHILMYIVFTLYPGFSFEGALIGLILGIWYLSKRLSVSFFQMYDLILLSTTPSVSLFLICWGVFRYFLTDVGGEIMTYPVRQQLLSQPAISVIIGIVIFIAFSIINIFLARKKNIPGLFGSCIVSLYCVTIIVVDSLLLNTVYYDALSGTHMIQYLLIVVSVILTIVAFLPEKGKKLWQQIHQLTFKKSKKSFSVIEKKR